MQITMLFNLLLIGIALATPLQLLSVRFANASISPIDFVTMRLLLYIEHLELYLFKQGCDKFSASDFVTAGFDSGMHENVCRIEAEKSAVVSNFHSLLEAAGKPPIIAECEYEFEFSGPTTWVDLANEVMMAGIGAYLGAVQTMLDNPLLQQFVATIATTEARHDTYLRAEYGAIPAPAIYDTPLYPTWTWNLAQKWIQSCPEPIGYPIFPPLSVETPWWREKQDPSIGKNLTVTLSWNPKDFLVDVSPKQPLYLAMVYNIPGDRPVLVPVECKKTNGDLQTGDAVIPGQYVAGVIFAALTAFKELETVADLVQYGTLAGPVEILMS